MINKNELEECIKLVLPVCSHCVYKDDSQESIMKCRDCNGVYSNFHMTDEDYRKAKAKLEEKCI